MKKCFIVASLDGRTKFLNECLDRYSRSAYANDDLYMYYQGDHFDDVGRQDALTDVVIDAQMRGVFTPRYELMKRYCLDYDYTVLIDDDLFITEKTDYDKTIKSAEKLPFVGCINNINRESWMKPFVRKMNTKDTYNIEGGMIFPRSSVELILDYFVDKEQDYTFDTFWLLLWVKGLDWYKDYRSSAKHEGRKKVNGEFTGYCKSLVDSEYRMIFPEWFNDPPIIRENGRMQRDIPRVAYAKQSAYEERMKNMKKLGRL